MRRLLVYSAFLLMLSLAVGACAIVGERGSGIMATESRDVSGFDQVDLSGSGMGFDASTVRTGTHHDPRAPVALHDGVDSHLRAAFPLPRTPTDALYE
jgi:hypothetical protein